MDAWRSQSYVAGAAPARPGAWHGHTHNRMTVTDVDVCETATTVSVEDEVGTLLQSCPPWRLAEWPTPL